MCCCSMLCLADTWDRALHLAWARPCRSGCCRGNRDPPDPSAGIEPGQLRCRVLCPHNPSPALLPCPPQHPSPSFRIQLQHCAAVCCQMLRVLTEGVRTLAIFGEAVCATEGHSSQRGSALYSDALACELQTFQILVFVLAVSRHALTKSKMRAVKYKSRPLMTQSTVVCAYMLNRLYN